MTSNTEILRKYMIDLGLPMTFEQAQKSDLFFDIQLIRRGKDHPNLPAANYTFKTYYITSIEKFDWLIPEIKKCCDMFGLRAYISVNAKSKQEATKKTCEVYAHNIVTNDYISPWKSFSSVCGGLIGKEKRWVVDVDDCDGFIDYIEKVKNVIHSCESSYDEPIVTIMPTKSGCHIITHPFNIKRFKDVCDALTIIPPDIKQNHLTLLYENL